MKFSVIVVALNPGEKLKITLDSIFAQTYTDYEIVLKDGGSKDGSMDFWKKNSASKVRFFDESDQSIYDAMNQAVGHAKGEFVIFLNCGDTFADEHVLEKTAAFIEKVRATSPTAGIVLYGDTLGEKNGVVISSPPEITGFTCYRNIPCHQSCFYSVELCREKPYECAYRIRADYEHFLWCFYRAKAKMYHMGIAVSCYEGGGYSESKENRKRDRQEHREITKKYMSGAELFRYKAIMALTLAPLRRALAESKVFSGLYHGLKEKLYGKKSNY